MTSAEPVEGAGNAAQLSDVLTAYRLPWFDPPLRLCPAEATRDWMASTRFRNATHCLPLLLANQHGWHLLNAVAFSVSWDGGDGADSTTITGEFEGWPPYVSSHFGHGIFTFAMPYLFRTARGVNLLARGPANLPKDGALALEGLVETDWAAVTFTMNWKLTRPGATVTFDPGEPVCFLVPQPRGYLERLSPEVAPLATMPDAELYLRWRRQRSQFRGELPNAEPRWQNDYMTGRTGDGTTVAEHQRRLHLKEFGEAAGGGSASAEASMDAGDES